MIGLGAGAEPGFLDFDEIADMNVGLQHRPGPQPGERADDRALRDRRAFEMRKRADPDVVGDRNTRAEHDMGLDDDIAPELRVGRQEHGFRGDQGRAALHRAAPQALLQDGFGLGQLGAGVDAAHLLGGQFRDPAGKTLSPGDRDDVG